MKQIVALEKHQLGVADENDSYDERKICRFSFGRAETGLGKIPSVDDVVVHEARDITGTRFGLS